MDPIASYLKRVPLFQELTEDECMDVVRAFSMLNLKAGQPLCVENEPGDAFFVVESGEVRVHKKTAQGGDEEIARIGANGVVGEMALLDGGPRSASVTAERACVVYRVDRGAFNLLRANLRPAAFKVIRYLARVLCEHLRDLNGKIEAFFRDPKGSLAQMKVRQREINAMLKARFAQQPAAPALLSRRPALGMPSKAIAKVTPYQGRSDLPRFLADVPFLRGIAPDQLDPLVGILKEQPVPAGELVCREGAVGDGFFIIGSGAVEVEKEIAGGATRRLAKITCGAIFGEISLIDGKRRSASCRAIEPTMVLRCARADFDDLFRSSSPLAFRFVERIAIDLDQRVRESNLRFMEIFSRPSTTIEELEQRLAEVEGDLERGPSESDRLLELVGYRGR